MKRSLAVLAITSVLSGLPAHAQEQRKCKPDDIAGTLAIADRSVPRGEPVRMKLIQKHTGTEPCVMEFPSGRRGTVRVFFGGHAVWEQGYCRAYTAHLEWATWEPGHREVTRFNWRQWTNAVNAKGELSCDGERDRAAPGRYEVEGIMFGTDPDSETPRTSFRITR